jgi:S-methylmethionine-dependent homocysteine/selenocysteine methylase
MKSSAGRGSKQSPRPLGRALRMERPVLLDGAMGTELEGRGIDTGLPLWSAGALLTSPGTVRRIHDDYIEAGAGIITSNTFRTTRRSFRRAGLPDRSAELTSGAVMLARESIAAHPASHVLLAGSMAPLEDCYRPDLVPSDDALLQEHGENAQRLAAAGVDFLLLETMGTVREAFFACIAARTTGLEFVVSFLCRGEGILYGGEPLRDAVRRVAELSPSAVSLNCSAPGIIKANMTILFSVFKEMQPAPDVPVGVYANVGAPGNEQGGEFTRNVGPAAYAECARSWIRAGASFVGGCCGTTPEYIRSVRRAIA